MIVRHANEADFVPLPNAELSGKLLVADSDRMNFTAYELRAKAGDLLTLKSGTKLSNHLYYCISGRGKGEVSDGQLYDFGPDVLWAFSSGISCTLRVEDDLRVFCVFCEDVDPTQDRAVRKKLEDIIGTERDIAWMSGQSRRFLTKKDDFVVGFHNTTGDKDTASRLVYKNHLEACYYIQGETTYSWEEGERAVDSQVQGTNYIMDKNDEHIMIVHQDAINLCVFFPALDGHEVHTNTSGVGYSSY